VGPPLWLVAEKGGSTVRRFEANHLASARLRPFCVHNFEGCEMRSLHYSIGYDGLNSPEKAGVGGSTPSLATIVFHNLAVSGAVVLVPSGAN
jgi:hypothetical protein